MPQSTDGGVRKQGRGYYRQSLQKLQAVVEAKLKEIAVLDAAREQMAEREQVCLSYLYMRCFGYTWHDNQHDQFLARAHSCCSAGYPMCLHVPLMRCTNRTDLHALGPLCADGSSGRLLAGAIFLLQQAVAGTKQPDSLIVQNISTPLFCLLNMLFILTLPRLLLQVLVDLVLQQEHHLSHLEQMRASLDADMANLDMLLSMDSTHVAASGNSSGALPEVAGSTGSLSTDSAAACSSGMVMTPCNGASHCSEGCAVAPAIAQLQALQQQPLQLQLQVQQWQQGSASAASDSGSNTPVGVTVSTALGDNRQQKIQVLLVMVALHYMRRRILQDR
jgi:hypothetical protein